MANCCVGHPTPLPKTTTTPRQRCLMDWSVLAFPLARLSCNTTPKSRQLTFRNAAEEGAAHGNKSRQRGQTGRPLALDSQHLRVNSVGQRNPSKGVVEREPDSMPPSRPSNKEDGKPLPLTPFQLSLGGWAAFLSLSVLSRKKKVLVVKKEFPLRPCMGVPTLKINMGIGTPPLFPARSPLTPRLGRCPSPINKGFFFSMPFRRCKRHGPAKEFGARGELANFY